MADQEKTLKDLVEQSTKEELESDYGSRELLCVMRCHPERRKLLLHVPRAADAGTSTPFTATNNNDRDGDDWQKGQSNSNETETPADSRFTERQSWGGLAPLASADNKSISSEVRVVKKEVNLTPQK